MNKDRVVESEIGAAKGYSEVHSESQSQAPAVVGRHRVEQAVSANARAVRLVDDVVVIKQVSDFEEGV